MTRWSVLVCSLLLSCKSDPPPPSTGPRVVTARSATVRPEASASASAQAAPRPRVIPSEQVISFQGQGVSLAASWFKASPEAPVVVLLHRLGGQRSEWQPLIQQLIKEGPELSILALDLRGHGQSGASEGRIGGGLQGKDIEAMTGDLQAALGEVDRRLERKASRVLGLGADLGATVLVGAASREPRWAALGLLAPVAGLRGVDIYKPFASVRTRPTLLGVAREDPVSQEPFKAMSSMVGATITTKTYEGTEHNVVRLAASTPTLWGDLVAWVSAVAGEAPALAPASAASTSAAPVASAPAAPSASTPAPSASGGKKK